MDQPVDVDNDQLLADQFNKRLNVDAPVFVPTFGPPTNNGNDLLANTPSPVTDSPQPVPTGEPKPAADTPNNVDMSPVDDWEQNAENDEEEDEMEEEDGDGDEGEPGALDSKPKRKSKRISETRDDGNRKEHINVVFIGHVDAGKSTIGGQLLFVTGMVDKRTLEKYEREAKEKNRESWYLSWALDTNLEEREKGKTVEVGRACFETEHKLFTLLDAPGHKGFVPNMIAGACQADLAVLVISARKGEFETGFERGGQTREHAMLVKTAGVKHMVVLINKMDDPTVEWNEERYNECKEKLLPYLKQCGFNPKTEISFMPCSGFTGAFLRDIPAESICPWYRGPSFLEYLDAMPPLNRLVEGPFRLPIIDKYKDMGTVVLGKIESGTAKKGTQLLLMPNRRPVEVLQLWSDDNEVNQVQSGENVKLKLRGCEEEDVTAGFVLCDPNAPCKVARIFDAHVVIVEYKSIICNGFPAVLHLHAVQEEVSIKAIMCKIDKRTGEKSKTRPRFVKQGEAAIIRFECLAGLVCMEPFSQFPQMGRFTLRNEGSTVAMGKVLRIVE